VLECWADSTNPQLEACERLETSFERLETLETSFPRKKKIERKATAAAANAKQGSQVIAAFLVVKRMSKG